MSGRAALVLLTCGLVAVVTTRLIRPVPESVEVPLATYFPGMQPMAVELPGLPYLTTSGVLQVHRLDLVIDRPEDMLRHQAVRLLVGTHDTFPHLVSADLWIVGTPCRYRTAPGAQFPNNDVLTLARERSCAELRTVPSGALLLTVRYTGDARVALWTYTQPAGIESSGAIRLKGPVSPEFPHQPSVRGSFIDEYRSSGGRVIDLLRQMWQLGRWSWLLTAMLVAAAAAILLSVLVCPLAVLPAAAAGRAAWRAALAAGLLAAGLSLVFAVVVPPFQAPDEPNHFLGFLALGGRSADRAQADQWARIGHFNQLRFNGAERYRPVDARQPQEATWTDASPSDFDRRSSITFVWRTIAALTRDASLPLAFLTLRVVHAGLFGLAFAVMVWAVVAGSTAGFRHLVFIPLLAVPTLPFFGMHVSNHAFLVSGYVLVAGGVALVFMGDRKRSTAAVLLTAGVALAILAGRSSLPLLPLIAAAAVAAWRSRDTASSTVLSGTVVRVAAAATALLLLLIVILSLFLDYPHVASVDLLHRPPAWRYLLSVLSTAATPRLRDADLLMTTSFWGGFGWLDRLLPAWAIAAYTAITAGSLIILLAIIARTRDAALFARGALLFLGATASLAVYAVGTLRYSPDIHGRYLVGLYLAGLAVCGSPILMAARQSSSSSSVRRSSALVSALLGMYTAVLWFVLGAYF